MTNYAQVERLALCTTFEQVGPDAPTLCEEWQTRDLAAHLVIRERRPDAMLGRLVPAIAARAATAADQVSSRPFTDLVSTVRSGPPGWHPTRLGPVDQVVNTAEFFVHHEDVLRAQPGWVAPRPLPEELQRTLWRTCGVVGRLALRSAPVGVELVGTGAGAGRAMVRSGRPVVTVTGLPSELLLFAFGRRAQAKVDLDGPADAVASLLATPGAV
ncbi:MAG TPA: TIGR03085 family metal-binding protein [Actinomycetales bacterium]|jgi:uncharacterized protein (TIGR03085 family)